MLSPFISVSIVSLISLVGVLFFFFQSDKIKKISSFFVSVAIGTMFADAFLHILPEANENLPSLTVGSLVLAGIIGFFLFERIFHWQHEHDPNCSEEHENCGGKSMGYVVLLGDGLHNFIDGILIGASYFISIEVGIATTIAVVLHEIPQEIGDFGILIHSGFTNKKALFYNFLSAFTAFAGLGFALLLQNFASQFSLWMLPITAGSFIYIAGSDLIPDLHRKKHSWGQFFAEFFAIALGVVAMALLLFLE
jgi:zinc and cadmium transporter